MAAATLDKAAKPNGAMPRESLVPRFHEPGHAGLDEDTTAWWALDVSDARSAIAAIARGAEPHTMAAELLAAVRIVDIDLNTVHLVGPYGGRRQMIGKSITAYWPAESWPAIAELIVSAVADFPPGAARTREITSIAFDDARLSISADKNRPDLVFISIGGTVTDDRSLWAVRASEERYQKLIRHLPIALLQVDAREIGATYEKLKREGVSELGPYMDAHPKLIDAANAGVVVTEANDHAARLFGVENPSDLIGPVSFVFAASPQSARRVMAARFEGRRSLAETMKLQTFDGRLLDVEISVTYPRPPERLDVTLISIEDITDRLRTEAQLRELQADYTRAARISMLGELATSIAHEVNQPLSAIVTNAETSLRWLSRPDPNFAKVGQLTSRIAGSARQASEIVQRIRGMAVQHAPERERLDLNKIVDEALLFVRHEIESRAIELSIRLGEALPDICGDRVQLQQVIVNLLLNAVQALGHSDAARGTIDLHTAKDTEGMVTFAIHDGGPGISGNDLDHIFDSFFTTKDDGMGIGLAICQSIITAHGGAIAADNHPEGGALFRFSLPAASVD
ncbi:sensor histidine kinase [Parasphingopyxis marina]|uniref:histidine kinase n=1 Tax=Parasphingopyxis marina TaxID=2761622 RepID=A0A842I3U6_9SPHN|nr:ATP-binding protein [Parasphingopyxis marina]MBC2779160.1 PAS domain-containing protein [Parasphingopyxis marina]